MELPSRDNQHGNAVTERERRAFEREQQRLRDEAGAADADARNRALRERLAVLDGLFRAGLEQGDVLDFEVMKHPPPIFKPGLLAVPEPLPDASAYAASRKWYHWIIPGGKARYTELQRELLVSFEAAQASWRDGERLRKEKLATYAAEHQTRMVRVEEQHRRIEGLQADYNSGKRRAVEQCVTWVLERSKYPSAFPKKFTPILPSPTPPAAA